MTLRFLAPALLVLTLPALAQSQSEAPHDTPAASSSAKTPVAVAPLPNPLPADKSTEQSITVNGHTLHYTATVGTITLKSREDKPTGEVMYIAYTLDQPKGSPSRPVTFAVNGGPGASSVYLNLGAIGPKHVAFANAGDSASDPATLTDNPGTWLDFTDLVFIDPIGTGYSRSLVPMDEAKKQFYGPDQDIEYLSKCVYDWLVKNGRLQSRKYLVGESYGGYRGPRLTAYLQSQIGVAMNGLVLVSPALAPDAGSQDLSPIPWMLTLPSIVAA